ncbi:MAG TPA: metallophosphoesterase [Chitinophagaceae bacterium]|nr:metallophosphoesterase [Chitinophagaceae bacterium]
MRRLVQIILLKPILWFSRKFTSRPERSRIFKALADLFRNIKEEPGKKGVVLSLKENSRIIIFSDHHRGAKNGADDFMKAETAYLAALDYYFENKFQYISLGDSEELWENTLSQVKKNNTLTFEAEKRFILKDKFFKVFGNHDLYWDNSPIASQQLKAIYGKKLRVFEGIILEKDNKEVHIPEKKTNDLFSIFKIKPDADNEALPIADCPLTIFLTHGHQGDASSDGNWFSKFFVANIWAPLQSYLRINFNTPAYDEDLKTAHNLIMYEWSAKYKNLVLITGHTHQPVFESLTHPERLYRQLGDAIKANNADEVKKIEEEIKGRGRNYKTTPTQYLTLKPSYFNSGCCCFRDGDITGIEITYEKIALVKWNIHKQRVVLEETTLNKLQEVL